LACPFQKVRLHEDKSKDRGVESTFASRWRQISRQDTSFLDHAAVKDALVPPRITFWMPDVIDEALHGLSYIGQLIMDDQFGDIESMGRENATAGAV
jgi:hypothetical protein